MIKGASSNVMCYYNMRIAKGCGDTDTKITAGIINTFIAKFLQYKKGSL